MFTSVREFSSEEDCKLIDGEKDDSLPHKHDLISCLGVGGRWITSKHNLQVNQYSKTRVIDHYISSVNSYMRYNAVSVVYVYEITYGHNLINSDLYNTRKEIIFD